MYSGFAWLDLAWLGLVYGFDCHKLVIFTPQSVVSGMDEDGIALCFALPCLSGWLAGWLAGYICACFCFVSEFVAFFCHRLPHSTVVFCLFL